MGSCHLSAASKHSWISPGIALGFNDENLRKIPLLVLAGEGKSNHSEIYSELSLVKQKKVLCNEQDFARALSQPGGVHFSHPAPSVLAFESYKDESKILS